MYTIYRLDHFPFLPFNYSDRPLTTEETDALARGLQFAFQPVKLNYCRYFLPFEKLFNDVKNEPIYNNSQDAKNRIRTSIKDTAFKCFYNYKSEQDEETKNIIATLKALSTDPSIVILKPDKGNGVVILNKADYESKMNSIIQDCTKFTLINDNDWFKRILKHEDQVNRYLYKLCQEKIIDKPLYDHLHLSSSRPGILYGLPKIHKMSIPLRPILSSIGTCGYKIAKFLVPILEPITSNQFTVRDSFTFATEISKFKDSNKYVMASFDIKSLFTNIPLDEAINIATESLFPQNDVSLLGLTSEVFRKLLQFAVKNVLFIFNNQLYQQIDGVAMGSPLGPTLANLFLCHHETKWLTNCPLEFKPALYRRYIDDTFLLFKDASHIDKFLNYLNAQHSSIQFTSEIETNSMLNFLAITIAKINNSFETSVFRKKTFTGLGMKFDSFLPYQFKFNLISCLIKRAFKICSEETAFNAELSYLQKYFTQNNFPANLFSNMFQKVILSSSFFGKC